MTMDRSKYPPDWPAISLRVREAAGWRCEWCGKPNGATLSVARGGWWFDADADVWRGPHGRETQADPDGEARVVRVVLTVAHTDLDGGDKHDKHNLKGLRALCQSCHLSYDRADHVANAARTRRMRRERMNPVLPGLTETHA